MLKQRALQHSCLLLCTAVQRVVLTKACTWLRRWRCHRGRSGTGRCDRRFWTDSLRHVGDAAGEARIVDHRVHVVGARGHADEFGEQASRRHRVVVHTHGNHTRQVLVGCQLCCCRGRLKASVGRSVCQHYQYARNIGIVGPHSVGYIEHVGVDALERRRCVCSGRDLRHGRKRSRCRRLTGTRGEVERVDSDVGEL